MNYSLQTQHIELSDADRDLIEKKMQRFEKRLQPPFVIDIVFSLDTHHATGDITSCRINIHHGKNTFHAERTGATAQDTLDSCLDALEQELAKNRDKSISLRRVVKRLFRR
jgi:ribosomal subunit interface protein